MRTESWCGHDIRFVEVNGEWYAILKDICDALKLRSKDISQRLDPDMMERVCVDASEDGSNGIRSRGENKTRWMLAVNELGIYEALFAINQKFGTWKEGVKMDEKMNLDMLGYAYTAYNNMYKPKTNKQKILEQVKDVIFNDPATIVYWKDGTKTVVKAEGEKFDPEKGLAMAIAKKHFGNEGTYYELFKKWLPKKEADDAITEFLTAKQLAEGTGQSVKSVQRDCRKGLYPGAKKVDGKWLIPLLGLVGGNKK